MRLANARRDVHIVKQLVQDVSESRSSGAACRLVCSAVEELDGRTSTLKENVSHGREAEDAPLQWRLCQLSDGVRGEIDEAQTKHVILKELHAIKRDLIRLACEVTFGS